MATSSFECKGGDHKSHEVDVDDDQGWKDIRFEDIELGKQIGGGGVGLVYSGWLGNHKEAVALKTLFDPRVDEAIKQDFMDELLIHSQLHHPNIVSIIGACLKPPNLFFVMELCEQSLFDLLHDSRPEDFTIRQQVQMALDVAKAMEYLHSRRPAIIHRDLKTHNLLIAADGSIKLCDFGLVRTKNTTAGTPNYMSPELLDNRPFNKTVDVYAFGIVLYEIFTQEVFLQGYDVADIRRKVVGGERPRTPTTDCPEALQDLMRRCWSQESSDRPSFEEIVDILLDTLASLPVGKSSLEELEYGEEDALDRLMGGSSRK